jgi:hypothetical protein
MFPLLSGLITGGASLLGSIFSSNTSAQNTQANIYAQAAAQRESESFNAGQTDLNRQFQWNAMANQQQFQQNMSGTAYQRAVSDMRAAGLNPMLAGISQSPASSPSGSAPSGSAASVGTPNMALSNKTSALAGLGSAVSSGIQAAVSAKTLDKMTEEIANLQFQEAKTSAETRLTEQRTATETYETEKKRGEADVQDWQAEQARILKTLPPWLRDTAIQTGWLSTQGGKAADLLGSLVSSASGVGRMLPKITERSRESAGGGSFDEFWKTRTGW